jgi:hypothetical protein
VADLRLDIQALDGRNPNANPNPNPNPNPNSNPNPNPNPNPSPSPSPNPNLNPNPSQALDGRVRELRGARDDEGDDDEAERLGREVLRQQALTLCLTRCSASRP